MSLQPLAFFDPFIELGTRIEPIDRLVGNEEFSVGLRHSKSSGAGLGTRGVLGARSQSSYRALDQNAIWAEIPWAAPAGALPRG